MWKSVHMGQQKRPNTTLAALVPVPCGSCGEPARLVGLEPAADGEDSADLCTYECATCGDIETRVFLRTSPDQLTQALQQQGLITGADGLAREEESDFIIVKAAPLAKGE